LFGPNDHILFGHVEAIDNGMYCPPGDNAFRIYITACDLFHGHSV
jgi:hypothetical protein